MTVDRSCDEQGDRRDEILQAVAFAASRFLRRPGDWRNSVQEVLACLGRATQVSRVYVFETPTRAGTRLFSQQFEWAADGINPEIDNPELKALDALAAGFGRWVDVLSAGQMIQGHIEDFPSGERAVLEPQHIVSIVVVPIFVAEAWWGFIGFDECRRQRRWSPAELEALRVAADTLGAAIQGHEAECALSAREAELRQSQKMEAVGRLAGGIAHDFNNLLTVILCQCDELVSEAKLDERQVSAGLNAIQAAARSAAALTAQLLAFSRKQLTQPRVVELAEAVREMEPMLKRLLGEDVSLRVHLPGEPCRIKIDSSQLSQVLMNLVVNARDALPAGGTIEIDVGTERARAKAIPSCVRLVVRDNGHGMSQEIANQVFDPFFTTKRARGGVGLGLSVAHGIISQAGGRISCESSRGQGTTMTVELPWADGPLSAPPAGPTNGADGAGMAGHTVLLVEDEAPVRDLVARILRRSGLDVLTAEDGEDALGVMRNHQGPIDLLITDLIMPRVDGRRLAEEVTALRPDTPVLYISGYTDDEMARRGIAQPATAFVLKPFTARGLLAAVRGALSRRAGPEISHH